MNKNKYYSPCKFYKFEKRTVDWFPRDTIDNFRKTSSSHQDYWNNQEKITYEINKYGFRSNDFPEEECRDSITFLGCSNTVGIGMNKEKTWSSLLANKMNLPEINLAVAAGSLDAAFRVYNEWQPIHKSKITCLLIPPGYRREVVRDSRWENLGSWSAEKIPEKELVDLLDKDYCDVNRQRNLAAIHWIAQKTDSTLIVVDYHGIPWNPKEPLARDGGHPGEFWHRRATEIFYNKLGKIL